MREKSLKRWIDSLQSRGRYTFLRAEAQADSGFSSQAVNKALQRAVKRGRLVRPKEYFYVIVPVEYSIPGAPPVSWYIHDLMAAIKLPYYVGLLSAAAIHGSAHHAPQVFQVVTDRSVRPIRAGRAKIEFVASKYVERAAAVDMKTDTGIMRVATPETTMVDLMRFSKSAGHLEHVAFVISELAEAINPECLVAALRAVNDIPNAQRLGYILDLARKRKLSKAVHDWVKSRIQRPQPLRPDRPTKDAPENRRWHLLINDPLKIEA